MTQTPTVAPPWVPHPRSQPPQALELARSLGAPPAIGHVLVNRGFADLAAAGEFLNPAIDGLHDPFLLLDLDRAVDRIDRALAGGERILVQGDYDVDGITSTYLLVTALTELGGR